MTRPRPDLTDHPLPQSDYWQQPETTAAVSAVEAAAASVDTAASGAAAWPV